MKGPVLCLCNFGQVRSVTMANRIGKTKNLPVAAAGMINTPPWYLDKVMSEAGTVIICNKPDVERRFAPDIGEFYGQMIVDVLDKHKEKTLICDRIGFDRWGKPMAPDLVTRCDEWLESIKE